MNSDTASDAMPVFDHTTKPSEAVRAALAWAISEVESEGPNLGLGLASTIDGTRYLRSKREFSVRRGHATLTMYFSGSKWNATGQGIWLHTGMAIRDGQLGHWRRANDSRADSADDFLDHVRLGTSDTVVWQPRDAAPNPFADNDLTDLPLMIRRSLSGAFRDYSDPLTAVNAVRANHLTAMNVSAFAEWALARDRPSDAAEVLRVALSRRPVLDPYVGPIARRLALG